MFEITINTRKSSKLTYQLEKISFFKFKAIWKDALQTKLKRIRADHPNNSLVQEFRLKYSKLGSGRPVKQKIGAIAERDRHKQVTNN